MAERSPPPSRPPPPKVYKMTDDDCDAMLAALQPRLEELDLSDNDLKDEVSDLCHFLRTSKLVSLKMSNCKLSTRSCELVVGALPGSTLKELDLSGNDLQDSGVEDLSRSMKSNSHLETLRLSRCGLTDACCEFLASALKHNPFDLKELDLSGNELTDQGMEPLFKLVDNSGYALKTLGLSESDTYRPNYVRGMGQITNERQSSRPDPRSYSRPTLE